MRVVMHAQIVCLCDNPDCGHVWTGNNPFGGASQLQITNCATSCPRCNGEAHIADAEYSPSGVRLFSRQDFDRLVEALKELRREAQAGATREQLNRTVNEKFPFLRKHPLLVQSLGFLLKTVAAAAITIGIERAINRVEESRAVLLQDAVVVQNQTVVVLPRCEPNGAVGNSLSGPLREAVGEALQRAANNQDRKGPIP